jgi:xanthine dehydrogenase molybdopterin-binding subunit B
MWMISSIDISKPMSLPGVVRFFSARDFQDFGGSNDCGLFPGDEPIFATSYVECAGKSIGFIVADSPELASRAASL